MARKQKQKTTSDFAELVTRLNAMSNMTPEQERAELMEAATSEPKILDDKDVSLADIAKLAGIKEYTEAPKVSKKAEKLVESITGEQSSITKAIKESDADDSIATTIKKEVTEEANRLDKIAELESQLAELKAEEKENATMDDKAFRETFLRDVTEFVKEADANDLVEMYNKFSENEVEMNENSFIIKTPETKEIIADAEQAVAQEEEKVDEKVKDFVDYDRNKEEPHTPEKEDDKEAEDKSDEKDDDGEVAILDKDFDEGEDVELPAEDKFTNDLDPQSKE